MCFRRVWKGSTLWEMKLWPAPIATVEQSLSKNKKGLHAALKSLSTSIQFPSIFQSLYHSPSSLLWPSWGTVHLSGRRKLFPIYVLAWRALCENPGLVQSTRDALLPKKVDNAKLSNRFQMSVITSLSLLLSACFIHAHIRFSFSLGLHFFLISFFMCRD